MEFLKNWIMGICGCTVLVSLICSLAPKTTTAGLLRVCGMILMIFTVFVPLRTFQTEDFQFELMDQFSKSSEEIIELNEEFEISIIEEKLSEYVLQRAKHLGIDCEVSVSVGKTNNGELLPQSIELCGPKEIKKLEHIIETECGIKPILDVRETRST